MIRLEILDLKKGNLRINLFEGISSTNVLKSYRTISMEFIQVYIDELIYHIPGDYLRNGPDVSILEKYKKKANLLFQTFFGEIALELESKMNTVNPGLLVVTMDESLVTIPFENFYTGEMFLWEGFIISRRIFIKGNGIEKKVSNPKKKLKAALIGNPSDDEKINNSVRNELNTIYGKIVEDMDVSGPHLGKSVDKYQIIESLSNSDVFHYSGHFGKKGKLTGWILDNKNIFSQNDVSDLSYIPKFIFSNSCGNSKEFSAGGFIRNFLEKGVESLISTTGIMPDKEAAFFSNEFYGNLLNGKTVGQAIHSTKKKLISRFGLSNLCWSFYVLFGSGTYKLFQDPKPQKLNIKFKMKHVITGLLVVMIGYMILYGLINFHSGSMHITSNPTDVEITINGKFVSNSPSNMEIRSGDLVVIGKVGFNKQQFKYGRWEDSWGLIPVDFPDVIIIENQIYPIQTIFVDSLYTILSNSDASTVNFYNKEKEFSLIIDKNKKIFRGNKIAIEVDHLPHRYIVFINEISYDQVLIFYRDTTIDIQSVETEWSSGRFN